MLDGGWAALWFDCSLSRRCLPALNYLRWKTLMHPNGFWSITVASVSQQWRSQTPPAAAAAGVFLALSTLGDWSGLINTCRREDEADHNGHEHFEDCVKRVLLLFFPFLFSLLFLGGGGLKYFGICYWQLLELTPVFNKRPFHKCRQSCLAKTLCIYCHYTQFSETVSSWLWCFRD